MTADNALKTELPLSGFTLLRITSGHGVLITPDRYGCEPDITIRTDPHPITCSVGRLLRALAHEVLALRAQASASSEAAGAADHANQMALILCAAKEIEGFRSGSPLDGIARALTTIEAAFDIVARSLTEARDHFRAGDAASARLALDEARAHLAVAKATRDKAVAEFVAATDITVPAVEAPDGPSDARAQRQPSSAAERIADATRLSEQLAVLEATRWTPANVRIQR